MKVSIVIGTRGDGYEMHSTWIDSVHLSPAGAEAEVERLCAAQVEAARLYETNPSPHDVDSDTYWSTPYPERCAAEEAWRKNGGRSRGDIADSMGVRNGANYETSEHEVKP